MLYVIWKYAYNIQWYVKQWEMKTALHKNDSMLALIEQVGIHSVNPPLLKIQSLQKTVLHSFHLEHEQVTAKQKA